MYTKLCPQIAKFIIQEGDGECFGDVDDCKNAAPDIKDKNDNAINKVHIKDKKI